MLDLTMLDDLHWMRDARCTEPRHDPDTWFPTQGRSTAAAKAVCQQCEVQAVCLAYAIGEDIREGVWGGMSPEERKEFAKSGGLLTPAGPDEHDVRDRQTEPSGDRRIAEMTSHQVGRFGPTAAAPILR